MVTSGSRLASIKLRAYNEAARRLSSARLRSVMSRAIDETPISILSESYIGETVSDTEIVWPSFRTRMVS